MVTYKSKTGRTVPALNYQITPCVGLALPEANETLDALVAKGILSKEDDSPPAPKPAAPALKPAAVKP